jgi:hypothetical protein
MEIKTQPFDTSTGTPNFNELYSDNQKIVYPDIRAGSAIPFGGNAARAGFNTGSRLGVGFSIIDVAVRGMGLH